MEHAHDSDSLSLFASWNSAPQRARPGLIIDAVVRILGIELLTRPRISTISRTWLRQHEVDADKHGQA